MFVFFDFADRTDYDRSVDESARAPCLPRYVSCIAPDDFVKKKNDPARGRYVDFPPSSPLVSHATGPRNFSCRPLDFTRSRGSGRGRPGRGDGRGSLSHGADIFPSVRRRPARYGPRGSRNRITVASGNAHGIIKHYSGTYTDDSL